MNQLYDMLEEASGEKIDRNYVSLLFEGSSQKNVLY